MIYNKRKKSESKYRIFILISLVILILIILNFTINRKESSVIELYVKGIINKVQQIIYPSIEKKDDKDIKIYQTENNELKKEIEELKRTLDLKNTFSNYEEINATVLYRDVGYWYETITIDKGKKHGINNGMLVMTYGGIIGRTVNVTNYSSDVKLLTSNDQYSKITVGIVLEDKTVYGLISGYDYKTNEILVDNIVDDIAMNNSIKVITSGLTGLYPEGILIGTVSKIEKDKYGLSKVVRIKPNADFKNIKYVIVLKRNIE